MKAKLAAVLGMLLVAAMTYATRTAANPSATDEQQIRDLEARYVKAFNAKDIQGIMSCFVQDNSLLVFDVVPPRQYVGAKAYAKDWRDFFAAFPGPITVRRTNLAVVVSGTVGFGHMFDHVALTDRNGKTVRLVARITHGYRKVGNQWLIAHEHVSVPVDLTTGKADLESKP